MKLLQRARSFGRPRPASPQYTNRAYTNRGMPIERSSSPRTTNRGMPIQTRNGLPNSHVVNEFIRLVNSYNKASPKKKKMVALALASKYNLNELANHQALRFNAKMRSNNRFAKNLRNAHSIARTRKVY